MNKKHCKNDCQWTMTDLLLPGGSTKYKEQVQKILESQPVVKKDRAGELALGNSFLDLPGRGVVSRLGVQAWGAGSKTGWGDRGRGEWPGGGGSGPGSGVDLETPKTQLYQHAIFLHLFAFSLHFFAFPRLRIMFFCIFFAFSQTGNHFFAFFLHFLDRVCHLHRLPEKTTRKWQKTMTRVLVKLRFWTFQLGPGSSHPRWMRKRQQMANKWHKNGNKMANNDKKWQANGKKWQNMTKTWHCKTGMTTKMTKPNDKKMTKINIQQPSEFAGKIFINLLLTIGRSCLVGLSGPLICVLNTFFCVCDFVWLCARESAGVCFCFGGVFAAGPAPPDRSMWCLLTMGTVYSHYWKLICLFWGLSSYCCEAIGIQHMFSLQFLIDARIDMQWHAYSIFVL